LAILALLSVAISAVWTVAWAKFVVHGFNLLTTFLPALVLGLGIDFSLHLLSRFSEARADGLGLAQAVALAVHKKAGSSFVAALTTAAVFCVLFLSRSRALWELGAIMCLGIVFSYSAAFLGGPALLLLVGRVFPNLRGRPVLTRDRLAHPYRNFLRLHKGVLFISAILTAIALAQAVRIQFKFASAELVPPTPGQAVAQELMAHFAGQLWLGETFRVFVEKPKELPALSTRMREHPLVRGVASAWDLLPGALLGEAARFRDLPFSAVEAGLGQLGQVLQRWPEFRQGLENTAALFSLAELQALLRGEVRRAAALARYAENFFRLADELGEVDPGQIAQALEDVTVDLQELESFAHKLRALPDEAALIDQILAFLPAEIRNRYRISRGYVLEVQVLPTIYEGKNLENFVRWLREQGLDYVGSAELQMALEEHMRRDFLLTSGLALLLIVLIVTADLRRWGQSVLAVVPLLMGYAWMLGGMALLGIRFNFTNIVISPLLIGLGVDGAVHLLHRVREEHGRDGVVRATAATAGAVLASYLTTMASFGALLAAHTPGLRFLGTSALLGLGFTTLWTVGFLPAALEQLRGRARTNKVS
ncbi:MAG: MMPL family transporter, partial [Candidatus Bipolaricaulaceae bacterium]